METHLSRSKSDFRCLYLVKFFLFIQCLGDGTVSRFCKSLCFCIMVTFFVYTDFLFVCSLCRKNLGIASAGAAGLKEFTQSLNGWEVR